MLTNTLGHSLTNLYIIQIKNISQDTPVVYKKCIESILFKEVMCAPLLHGFGLSQPFYSSSMLDGFWKDLTLRCFLLFIRLFFHNLSLHSYKYFIFQGSQFWGTHLATMRSPCVFKKTFASPLLLHDNDHVTFSH